MSVFRVTKGVVIGFIALTLLALAIGAIEDISTNSKKALDKSKQQPNQAEDNRVEVTPFSSPTNQIEMTKGNYLDYQYIILNQTEEQTYTSTFNPFLPRNDTVVTGAMLEVINQTFGKHTVKNLIPQIVERNGKNLIFFEGTTQNYYFLLIKEDTGEVHSFVFWSE